MTRARTVLLVSYFYPPDGSVGGRRVAGFARHLPDAGWRPVVLTAEPGPGMSDEPGPAGSGPPDVEVHATPARSLWPGMTTGRPITRATGAAPDDRSEDRSDAPRPAPLRERLGSGRWRRALYFGLRHLLPMSPVRMPDATLGWVYPAVAQGLRILETRRIDAIVSSAGPPSAHLTAAALRSASGLPWIADYRDLWSGNHWDLRVAPFERLERVYERRTLRSAALLSTVTGGWAERLAGIHDRPAEVVHNGFEPADYPAEPGRDDGFVLTYVGSLYYPHQDPEPLFAAVRRLADAGRLEPDGRRFRIRFLGGRHRAVREIARRYGIEDSIETLAPVPYRESLRHQCRSSALLYLAWRDPAHDVVGLKLFEYLGAARPVLSVGPPGGTLSEILDAVGLPEPTADPDAIAGLLDGWISEMETSGRLRVRRNEGAVQRFTRAAATERLAGLLERAVGGVRS